MNIMKFNKSDVTMITCNWNMTRLTMGAIRNFRKYYPDIKMIVVDDGSGEYNHHEFMGYYKTMNWDERWDPDIKPLEDAASEFNFKIIKLPEHIGHGAAIDYGVDECDTPLFLTFDNDIRLLDGTLLDEYLDKMNEDPDNIFSVGTTWQENSIGAKWIGLWLGEIYHPYEWDLKNRFKFIAGDTKEIGKNWDKKIQFLFIDGDHSYDGVMADMNAWIPHMDKNGFIGFHDFDHPTNDRMDVTRVVYERLLNNNGWRIYKANYQMIFFQMW